MSGYICTIKKGAKRYGVGSLSIIGGSGCLSMAEAVFAEHGIVGDVSWREQTMKQKNFAAMTGAAQALVVSEETALHLCERNRARDYRRMGRTWQTYFASQEPKFINEAEYLAL